jgi:hypothetical protein
MVSNLSRTSHDIDRSSAWQADTLAFNRHMNDLMERPHADLCACSQWQFAAVWAHSDTSCTGSSASEARVLPDPPTHPHSPAPRSTHPPEPRPPGTRHPSGWCPAPPTETSCQCLAGTAGSWGCSWHLQGLTRTASKPLCLTTPAWAPQVTEVIKAVQYHTYDDQAQKSVVSHPQVICPCSCRAYL